MLEALYLLRKFISWCKIVLSGWVIITSEVNPHYDFVIDECRDKCADDTKVDNCTAASGLYACVPFNNLDNDTPQFTRMYI